MEFKKNQIVELYIDDIGNEGEGIGHIDGYALFLKDAVIGDKVRAKIIKTKKNYGFARVEEVIEASKDRVSPRCSKARQCGGCTLQHLAYEKQLEYKFNKVKNCLERIGGLENIEEKMEPILGMEEPFYYRNKAQFPVGYDKEGNLITGFYAGRTHHIIDCTHCMIQHPVNEQILLKVLDYMKKNNITAYDEKTHKGLVRHIVTRVGFKTGEIMVCLVINGKDIPAKEQLVEELCQVKGMTSISYSINQEKQLKVFLRDGEVPIDNSASERSIRTFCIGKKNWVIIDSIKGAEASAVIYSISETAKLNNLSTYNYFCYLLTELPKLADKDGTIDKNALASLMPWSTNLPEKCRIPRR